MFIPELPVRFLRQKYYTTYFILFQHLFTKTSVGFIQFYKNHIKTINPTAYFINASRSAILDEVALIEALREKRIAGAGLDVFENIIEKTARIWIDVQSLGGAVEISKEDCEYYYDFFMNKYGQGK